MRIEIGTKFIYTDIDDEFVLTVKNIYIENDKAKVEVGFEAEGYPAKSRVYTLAAFLARIANRDTKMVLDNAN